MQCDCMYLRTQMKILHLLTCGGIGGIETLCRAIGEEAQFENGFCFLTENGDIYDQMSSMGMTLYDLSGLGRKLSAKKIIKLISIAKNYDVIIVHHGDPYLKVYYLLVSIFSNKKMISVIHSCYDTMYLSKMSLIKIKLQKQIFEMSFRVSDLIVFVSYAGMESYARYFSYNFTKNSKVIYNGISKEILELGRKNTPHFNIPYNITYIGRLSYIKGVQNLIEAYANVKNERKDISLTIVGDGEYRATLEKRVKELKLEDVVFVGKTLNVSEYLTRADIFIYPSISEEVFGISIVEAMAFGIPCIASNIGGIPEIIHCGYNGWLCIPNDAIDLQRKLTEVIEEIEKRDINIISENAKQTALEFSIMNTIENLENTLSKLTNENIAGGSRKVENKNPTR